MRRSFRLSSLFLALGGIAALGAGPAAAQVPLPTLGQAYTQNFDTLGAAAGPYAFATDLPAGWFGFESGTANAVNQKYIGNDGSNQDGDTYSYGAQSATTPERALGSLASNAIQTKFGAAFTNTTNTTITELVIEYTGEMWRFGQKNRSTTDSLEFDISLNASSLNDVTATWVRVSSLDFVTPGLLSQDTGAKDGNLPANRTALSVTLTSLGAGSGATPLNIPTGATFWIRWTDVNVGGNDDGLAVDDFSLTPNGVPVAAAPSVDLAASASLAAIGQNHPGDIIDGSWTFEVLSTSEQGVDELAFTATFKDFLPAENSVEITIGSTPAISVTLDPNDADGGALVNNVLTIRAPNGTPIPAGTSIRVAFNGPIGAVLAPTDAFFDVRAEYKGLDDDQAYQTDASSPRIPVAPTPPPAPPLVASDVDFDLAVPGQNHPGNTVEAYFMFEVGAASEQGLTDVVFTSTLAGFTPTEGTLYYTAPDDLAYPLTLADDLDEAEFVNGVLTVRLDNLGPGDMIDLAFDATIDPLNAPTNLLFSGAIAGKGSLDSASYSSAFTSDPPVAAAPAPSDVCAPVGIPYSEDFSSTTGTDLPACMTTEKGNPSDKLWETTSSATGFTGRLARISWTPAGSPRENSWLFTPGLNLTAGVNYRLSYKVGTGNYNECLKVFVGTGPHITDMSAVALKERVDFQQTTPATDTITFSVPNTGPAYIGFQACSLADKYYIYLDDISVALAPATCSGQPDLGYTTASANPACVGAPLNLATSNPPPNLLGLTYQWQVHATGTPDWVDIAGEINPTATISFATPGAYRLKATCSAIPQNPTASAPLAITAKPATECYCTPPAASTYFIQNITTTGAATNLNNTTTRSAGGYGDYTALPFEAAPGAPLQFSLSAGNSDTYNWKIWVDWNQDGVFNDTNERLVNSGGYKASPYVVSATLPADAAAGTYRFRVRNSYSTLGDACASASGETEDYTLKIAVPACTTPGAPTITDITTTSAVASWPATPAPSNFLWELRTSGAPGDAGAVGSGATDSPPVSLTGLTANTAYQFYVRQDCGANGTSTWTTAASFRTPCGFADIPYSEDFSATTGTAIPNCMTSELLSGKPWETTSSATGFTGRVAKVAFTSAGEPVQDTWLFTQGLTLQAGTTYRMSYRYGNNSTTYTESMSVHLGTAAAKASMTTVLADHPTIKIATPTSNVVNFTVPTAGVYYIGFKDYSIANQFNLYLDDILVELAPSGCTAVPALGDTTASASPVCSGTNVTLATTIAPPDETNLTYQWQFQATGSSTWTDLAGKTGATATVSATAAGSYRLQATCGADSGGSTPVAVALKPATECYCTPVLSGTRLIKSVTTTGATTNLANSDSGRSPNGYGDFTALPFVADTGTALSFTLTAGDPATDTYKWGIWVDWNQDGAFNDTDERVFYDNIYHASPYTVSVTIPTATAAGSYRVRIRNGYSSLTNACDTTSSGEIEDYALQVVIPACVMPGVPTFSDITEASATATWTASSSAPAGYLWELRTSGAPGDADPVSSGSTATPSLALTGLTANTAYQLYVRADCGTNGLSGWAAAGTFRTLCGAADIPYSEPFTSTSGTALPTCMTSQILSGKPWITGTTSVAGFTDRVASVTYDFSVPKDAWLYTQGMNLTGGVTYRLSYRYGNNSTSDTEKLKVAYGTSPTNTAMTIELADHPEIKLNNSATNSVLFTPTATGVYFIGFQAYSAASQWTLFVDDILVEVGPTACTAAPALGDTTASLESACANDALTLGTTVTAPDEGGLTLQWQRQAAGSETWEDLAGKTSATASVSFTGAASYRLVSTCGTDTTTSTPIAVAATDPTLCGCVPTIGTVEPICSVEFANINNSGTESNTVGIAMYVNLVADVQPGSQVTLAVSGDTDGDFADDITAFFDWNRDGVYETAVQVGTIEDSACGAAISTEVTVPADAALGVSRFLVVKKFNGALADACGSVSYGQAHVYSVRVAPAVDCPALGLNKGDACDDSNLSTRNDVVTAACICEGEGFMCPTATTCTSYAPNGTDCTPTFAAAGTSCDDASFCTTGDQCNGQGTCSGAPLVCADGETCLGADGCVATHCTACTDDAECGTNSACLGTDEGNRCFLSCEVDDDCEAGQACREHADGSLRCFDTDEATDCQAPTEPGDDGPGPNPDENPEVVEGGDTTGGDTTGGDTTGGDTSTTDTTTADTSTGDTSTTDTATGDTSKSDVAEGKGSIEVSGGGGCAGGSGASSWPMALGTVVGLFALIRRRRNNR